MKHAVTGGHASQHFLMSWVLGLSALIALIFWVGNAKSDRNLLPVTQAKFWQLQVEDEQRILPAIPPSTLGQDIHLPHSQDRKTSSSLSSYMFNLELPDMVSAPLDAGAKRATGIPVHGLLFLQIVNGADFYLNGSWVAGLPRSNEAYQWLWFRPMLVPLLPSLLHQDGRPNVLTVVQSTYSPYLTVSRPYVGTLRDLGLVYEMSYFFTSMLSNTSNVFCFVMGFFMLSAWLIAPKKKQYALAGLVTLACATLFSLAQLQMLPSEWYVTWRATIYLCIGSLVSLMTAFVFSFIQQPLSKKQILLIFAYVVGGPLIYTVAGIQSEILMNRIWTTFLLLLYFYATVRLALYCFQTRSVPAIFLLIQSIFCIVLGLHDYVAVAGWLADIYLMPDSWNWWSLSHEGLYLLSLGVPGLSIIMACILLFEYRDQAISVTNANEFLQTSLHEREIELNESYSQQKKLELSEATRLERDRIYLDMHDGIGSRLVSTMFRLRQGRLEPDAIEVMLKDCLSDLRLVINAQIDDQGDIQNAVFDHCLLQELTLQGSPMSFSYELCNAAPLHLPPQVHLNILRILQESITNAIKHSQASEIHVLFELKPQELLLSVIDNGIGLSASEQSNDAPSFGASGKHGVMGMLARAKTIGGEFSLGRIAGKTRAQLQLPLAPMQSPSRLGIGE
jgi:signal transduction histidine kinase